MSGPSTRVRNLYQVLGIDRTASSDDVKRAYRKRALETHPDKLEPSTNQKQKEAAERLFHAVHEAFEVLGDPIKRHMYDQQLIKRLETSTIVQEAARRDKQREEWARLRREESERRISALLNNAKPQSHEGNTQQTVEIAAAETPASTEITPEDKLKREADVVAEILKGIYESSPELAARREAALKAKAERQRKELERQATTDQQPVPS